MLFYQIILINYWFVFRWWKNNTLRVVYIILIKGYNLFKKKMWMVQLKRKGYYSIVKSDIHFKIYFFWLKRQSMETSFPYLNFYFTKKGYDIGGKYKDVKKKLITSATVLFLTVDPTPKLRTNWNPFLRLSKKHITMVTNPFFKIHQNPGYHEFVWFW